ncbi:Acetamidase [Arthrobotrys entomopaga]|nr:Acetamidase [Arthrobotrys entomopaga]
MQDWEIRAQRKRDALKNLIPVEWRLQPATLSRVPAEMRNILEYLKTHLSGFELEITEMNATELLEKMKVGDLTAAEVTRAFCHRAAIANQLVNCLSEIHFEAAMERAQELDKHIAETKTTIGPLHGLPISLKDRFHIAGLASACGYVSWLDDLKRSEDEGTLVKCLHRLGAVFFVKTNVPTSLLVGETDNNIIGMTFCPYNRQISAGGASGGEAALLAARGSPLGWGTDIAGSIRIPSALNNLFGLRPSHGRFPASGIASTLTGLPIANAVPGPMAADLKSLAFVTKCIVDAGNWNQDHDVYCLPWRQDHYDAIKRRAEIDDSNHSERLLFGMMKNDGIVTPHPPIARALRMVEEALIGKGYEVIPWEPPPHSAAANILFQILGSTAGQEIRTAIDASGEPPTDQLKSWYDDDEQGPSLTPEFWNLCHEREQYREKYHSCWNSSSQNGGCQRPVDGIIMPVTPTIGLTKDIPTSNYCAYTATPSLLDYTAISFPVTFVNSTMDIQNGDPMFSDFDRSLWEIYDLGVLSGSPVGLQLVCRRLEEEKAIALTEVIMQSLKDRQRA